MHDITCVTLGAFLGAVVASSAIVGKEYNNLKKIIEKKDNIETTQTSKLLLNNNDNFMGIKSNCNNPESDQNKDVGSLEATHNDLQDDKLKKLRDSIDELDTKFTKVKENFNNLCDDFDDAIDEYDQLEINLINVKRKSKGIGKKIDNLKFDFSRTKENFQKLRLFSDNDLDSLASEIDQSVIKLEGLKNEMEFTHIKFDNINLDKLTGSLKEFKECANGIEERITFVKEIYNHINSTYNGNTIANMFRLARNADGNIVSNVLRLIWSKGQRWWNS